MSVFPYQVTVPGIAIPDREFGSHPRFVELEWTPVSFECDINTLILEADGEFVWGPPGLEFQCNFFPITTSVPFVAIATCFDPAGEQWAAVPDSPSLAHSGDLSVCGWAKFNSVTGQRTLIAKWSNEPPAKKEWRLEVKNGKVWLYSWDGLGQEAQEWQAEGNQTIQTDKWYFIAAMIDRVNNTAYVGSAAADESFMSWASTSPFFRPDITDEMLRFAAYESSSGTPIGLLDGALDEWAYWNIYGASVELLFNSGRGMRYDEALQTDPNLAIGMIAWWGFDDNTDSHVNGHDMAFIGGPEPGPCAGHVGVPGDIDITWAPGHVEVLPQNLTIRADLKLDFFPITLHYDNAIGDVRSDVRVSWDPPVSFEVKPGPFFIEADLVFMWAPPGVEFTAIEDMEVVAGVGFEWIPVGTAFDANQFGLRADIRFDWLPPAFDVQINTLGLRADVGGQWIPASFEVQAAAFPLSVGSVLTWIPPDAHFTNALGDLRANIDIPWTPPVFEKLPNAYGVEVGVQFTWTPVAFEIFANQLPVNVELDFAWIAPSIDFQISDVFVRAAITGQWSPISFEIQQAPISLVVDVSLDWIPVSIHMGPGPMSIVVGLVIDFGPLTIHFDQNLGLISVGTEPVYVWNVPDRQCKPRVTAREILVMQPYEDLYLAFDFADVMDNHNAGISSVLYVQDSGGYVQGSGIVDGTQVRFRVVVPQAASEDDIGVEVAIQDTKGNRHVADGLLRIVTGVYHT